MTTSLVSLLFAAFVGVFSVSSVEPTTTETPAPTISMEEYDTVADSSALEYTYPVITLSDEQYARVLSGAFAQSQSSGSGLLLVTYSDFTCPFCQRLHEDNLVSHLQESFPGIPLKRVEKHFSIFSQDDARNAAHLAQCAGSIAGTEAYYRASDSIFRAYIAASDPRVPLTADMMVSPLARQIGVSRERVTTCMADQTTADAIDAGYAEFLAFGFQGTPSVLIVDEHTLRAVAVVGAQSMDYFGTAAAFLLRERSDAR